MSREDKVLAGLYPFLSPGREKSAAGKDSARTALLESISLKADDSVSVKRAFFTDQREAVLEAAELIAASFRKGGRLLAMGNGGSSCDAQHVAVEFLHPVTAGRPALPAINLVADTATITAIANDVGYGRVFARQIEALGSAGDVVLGISTSGESENLMTAFKVAKGKGLTTIGLAGGGGGAMARDKEVVDLCLVVPSSSIHRVQECHVALYHILWDLVHTLLAGDRTDLKKRSERQ